ncbi:hypothetical protein J3E74DRAFT_410101 [Bipolaris maydis]|nr:hypothetical protein J3E74DRAFT_410101 [Bipolaris maydis]
MQRMQRITGRFLTRTPNEADVEAMLKDFEDSKVMLEKLVGYIRRAGYAYR